MDQAAAQIPVKGAVLSLTGARRRRWRRALVTGAIVLGVLLGATLMFPYWASTEQGRQYALQQLNKKLNGTLNVRNWSLGWFSGIHLDGVTVAGKNGRHVFECASLETDLTLWGWMWGNYDLGNTVITAPRLTANHYSDGMDDIRRLMASPGGATGSAEPSALAAVLASLRGSIRIDKGEVLLTADSTGTPLHLTGISAVIPVASSATPVHLTLDGLSVVDGGTYPIHLTGDLPAVERWHSAPLSLLWHLDGQAGGLPLDTLTAWCGLGTGWEECFGPRIERVALASEPRGAAPMLRVEMTGHEAALNFRMMLGERPTATVTGHGTGPAKGAVVKLLAYINPLLASVEGARKAATIDWTLDRAEFALDEPAQMEAYGTVRLTGARLGASALLGRILSVAPNLTAPSGSVLADIAPMRVQLGDQQVTADPVVIRLPDAPAMTFTGSTGLDGSEHLLLTWPLGAMGTAIARTTLRLPIRGTLDKPILDTSELTPAR